MNMDTQQEAKLPDPVSPGEGKRPPTLTLLCVLTFIGSGFSALSQFMLWVMFPALQDLFAGGAFDSYFSMVPYARESMEQLLSSWRHYYALLFLLYGASLAGAVLMWKLRRNGFHVYTIAQCLLLIVSVLMAPEAGFPWGSLVWTALFVGMYAVHLRYLHAKEA